jgi:ArsR family transcriptional regulator, arsenate/arsenite/antimonite-responsive transcriptional repressor
MPICSLRWGRNRLRIMRLLLSAHPEVLVVGEIQSELGIPNSTLSHHLEKLKIEGLVKVRRESTFLWYMANTEALEELLGFLCAECCTRNQAVKPEAIITLSNRSNRTSFVRCFSGDTHRKPLKTWSGRRGSNP